MRRAVLCCCLSLAFAGSWAQPAEVDSAAVERAQTSAELSRLVERLPEGVREDKAVKAALDRTRFADRKGQLVRTLRLREALDPAAPQGQSVRDPGVAAQEILSHPRYRDTGDGRERTWATGALERLGEWVNDLLRRLFPEQRAPTPGGLLDLQALTPVVWVVLAVGLAIVLALFVLRFQWAPARKRRAGGVLAEDEPDLTADEWLERAAGLEREGRFREAVRCLYLACLIRFDEGGVARFVRTDTNWEHHRRVMASAKRPEGLDFTPPTRDFDEVWYGSHNADASTLARMRTAYEAVLDALGLRRAA